MENIEQIIKQQHDYFKTLKTHEYAFRMKQLTLLYQKIKYYQKEIEEALYLDLRKTAFEAYSTEIGYVLSSIENTKKHLKKWMKSKTKLAPYYLFGAYDKIIYRPLGISLIIGPFNYPFQLIFEPLIGAIAAGNCAIIKPSENAIATSKIIAKIIKETFEAEYICCILGDVSTTIQLTHSQVDHIFFTGSIGTGKKIMAAASEQLIPVTLELGGKSPVIVDQSAKLKDAVQKIAWGKILNAGQTCVAPDYLIIKEELKDKFIELWKETVNIFLSNDDYGRIINEKHFKRLIKMFEGEEIYAGGNYNADDLWIEPTLVNGNKSNFMNEEIFGPILPIITYKDRNEIEILVEKHPFPLALYIFSNDKQFINYLTKRLSFGGACINDCITHLISPKVPFGGIRYSGIGQYHGKDSFMTFSHKQTIHHRFIKKDLVSLYPPYSKRLYKLVTKILK
ncbi:aldehyde dehydrogenase [Thomasclavelia spiroformis]|uniref:aldehyde dehydrogenase n=1 Tax=Thomasclavelia spiroformis TaxID=29348 RepID=UPI00241F649C|nr:aldehyde dehydrogenase [Thomasclavelia spiroformis]MBS6115417.1 aldehyde dehydrogenase [Thomasclavelia spiroformis]